MRRREFLAGVLSTAGLMLSYGLLGSYALAFLFPPQASRGMRRLFLGRRSDFPAGSTRTFVDQRGRTLLLVASGAELLAFDTRCPHLGCKVHWEPEHERFFCPCHQGVFDRAGVATAGPPATAGQSLARVALEVDAASGTVFLREES